MTTPAAISALWLSMLIAAIAVPLNTIFGVGAALVIVRGKTRGRAVLDALIDLPFVVSPVIVGLALILVYGERRLVRRLAHRPRHPDHLRPAGMVLATDLRVAAVRRARGRAGAGRGRRRAGAGRRDAGRIVVADVLAVTLPSIRWGVAYGVVLTTARALGEIGAVAGGLLATSPDRR